MGEGDECRDGGEGGRGGRKQCQDQSPITCLLERHSKMQEKYNETLCTRSAALIVSNILEYSEKIRFQFIDIYGIRSVKLLDVQ